MSESGLGTGQVQLSDGGRPAFLWDQGELIPLEPPTSPYSSWGADVTSKGLVVGQRFEGGNRPAVFWGRQTATVIAPRGSGGEFYDVNERGLAVGQARRPGDQGWAFLWYRGRTWVIDDFVDAGVGCNYFDAQSLNERNQVAVIRSCPAGPMPTRRCALMTFELSDEP